MVIACLHLELRHRMVRRPEAELQGVTEVAAVQRVMGRVPVPR